LDAGVAVQPLTDALAAAMGVSAGVVVADVQEGSAAAGLLETGDVITAIGGQAAHDPDTLLLQLGSKLALGPVEIAYVRARQPLTTSLRAVGADLDASTAAQPVLQAVRGEGSRIATVPHGSAFQVAGLIVGDLIVGAGTAKAPSPAEVRRQLAETPDSEFLVLVVRRADRQRVIAVQPRRRRERIRDGEPR
jgi:S1-C subfamily serine protease